MTNKHSMNNVLFDLAQWKQINDREKTAFVPAGPGDPAAGGMGAPPPGGMPPDMPPGGPAGMPPMDPMAMAGGMPPAAGGMPPDMGGMPMPPPLEDPAAGGGMPPGMDIGTIIQQAVDQTLQSGAAGGAVGPTGPGKGAKVDPGMIYMLLGRVQKLLTNMYTKLNWELPPDILNDDMTAQFVAGQGGPAGGAPPPGGEPPAPVGMPAVGGEGALNPLAGPKIAQDLSGGLDMKAALGIHDIREQTGKRANKIDAMAELARSLNK